MQFSKAVDEILVDLKKVAAYPKEAASKMEKENKKTKKEYEGYAKECKELCESFDEGLSKQVKKFLDCKPETRNSLVEQLQTTLSSYEEKCKRLRDKYRKVEGDQVVHHGNAVAMMIHENLLPQLKTLNKSLETILKNPSSKDAPTVIKTAMKNWSTEKDKLEDGIWVAVNHMEKSRAADLKATIATCKDLISSVNEKTLSPFKKLDEQQSFSFDVLNKYLALAKKLLGEVSKFFDSPTGGTLKVALPGLDGGLNRISEAIATIIAEGVAPGMKAPTQEAGQQGKK